MPPRTHKVFPNGNHIKGLKKLLKHFGTQASIADSLGVSRQLVNDWFCGRNVISMEHAYRLERMVQNRVTFNELRPDFEKTLKKTCKVKKHNV